VKNLKNIFFVFIALFLFFFVSSHLLTVNAIGEGENCTNDRGGCDVGGTKTLACSCPQVGYDLQTGVSAGACLCKFKPDDQVDCYHTICPVGYSCSYSGSVPEKQAKAYCISGGGGGNTCSWTQYNCPPGTVIDLNQPGGKFCAPVSFCPAPGTAQIATGVCCHMVHIPASDCSWVYKPAYNKEFWECKEPAEDICTNRELQNYNCKAIGSPTPTKTPTPIPTRTPTPNPALICQQMSEYVGSVNVTSNIAAIRYGNTVIFNATANNTGRSVKSMTFQLLKNGVSVETKVVNAVLTSGVWNATYTHTFNSYGTHRVRVTAVTPL